MDARKGFCRISIQIMPALRIIYTASIVFGLPSEAGAVSIRGEKIPLYHPSGRAVEADDHHRESLLIFIQSDAVPGFGAIYPIGRWAAPLPASRAGASCDLAERSKAARTERCYDRTCIKALPTHRDVRIIKTAKLSLG
jgi:hypothetical protein